MSVCQLDISCVGGDSEKAVIIPARTDLLPQSYTLFAEYQKYLYRHSTTYIVLAFAKARRRFDEIKDPRIREWYTDYVNVRATGGESFMDQHLRLRDFIDELKSKNYNRVAIFTHGGILMQAMLIFGLATPENIIERQPSYVEMLSITL